MRGSYEWAWDMFPDLARSTTRSSPKELTVEMAIKAAARGESGRYAIEFGGPNACGLRCTETKWDPRARYVESPR